MNRLISIVLIGLFLSLITAPVFAQEQPEDEELPRDVFTDRATVNTGISEGTAFVSEYLETELEGSGAPTPESEMIMFLWHVLWLVG